MGREAIAVARFDWSPGSAARFVGVFDQYVEPVFGPHPVAELDRAAVLDWLAGLDDLGVGPATKVKALATLRRVIAEAQHRGLLEADPTSRVSIRKQPHSMGRALNEHELARLIGATDDPLVRAQLLIAGVMGLRWGEFAALNVGDVDLDEGLIHVRASLARGRGRYEIKAPKTTTSLRAVPVPEVMGSLLRGITRDRSGPLFLATSGSRLNYHSSRRLLIRVAAHAGVADCTGWHVLRRTAGTLALRAGLNLKDVQALLGHSTPSQSLSAYVAARDMLALGPRLNDVARAAVGGHEEQNNAKASEEIKGSSPNDQNPSREER